MGKYHFGYGSNMWFKQMKKRCPDSKKIGIGELKDFKWIISDSASYANIVKSEGDYVRGFVFWISKKDEEGSYERRGLDSYEGYPNSYKKKCVKIELLSGKEKTCMIYIDEEYHDPATVNMDDGACSVGCPCTYSDRINNGIKDGLNFRVREAGKKRTKAYVRKYIRKFIPKPS